MFNFYKQSLQEQRKQISQRHQEQENSSRLKIKAVSQHLSQNYNERVIKFFNIMKEEPIMLPNKSRAKSNLAKVKWYDASHMHSLEKYFEIPSIKRAPRKRQIQTENADFSYQTQSDYDALDRFIPIATSSYRTNEKTEIIEPKKLLDVASIQKTLRIQADRQYFIPSNLKRNRTLLEKRMHFKALQEMILKTDNDDYLKQQANMVLKKCHVIEEKLY